MDDQPHSAASSADSRRSARHAALFAVPVLPIAAVLALTAPPARAVDGCLVLLCLAAPSWRALPECVPPIRQLFRHLSRGRPFPTCDMSGPGNASRHDWARAPGFCPPQYTREVWRPNGSHHVCDYRGAISVTVDGQLWSRTWWNSGDSVTEFSDTAKASLTSGWDTRFDDDFARWQASRPASSEQ